MRLGELHGPFPFGVVLVQDEASKTKIPRWSSEAQQVTAVDTAMVIKIQHEVDGPATVRVWDETPPRSDRFQLARVRLLTPSGTLVVSTAANERSIRLPVPKGWLKVVVLASESSEAEQIDLILRPDEEGHPLP